MSLAKNCSSPTYRVRAITCNTSSPKAQALALQGAEVVQANLDDAASIAEAFKGAHAIYLLTNFWDDISDTHKEREQGRRAIDIASSIPTLDHLVWSALPSITKILGGKYKHVIHYDSKAEITEHLREKPPELWKKTTVLWIAPYFQIWYQFPELLGPEKQEDGSFVLKRCEVRDAKCPYMDASETGKVVREILDKGRILGGRIGSMVGDDATPERQRFEEWGKVVNCPVEYKEITPEDRILHLNALGLPEFLVKDMSELTPAFQDFEGRIYRGPDVIQASEILPEGDKLQNWRDYLHAEDWELMLQK